jgi:hypothetical protein
MRECVQIDRQYLEVLRRAYLAAIDQGMTSKDVIKIDGREYVMQYLKYLIEYAEGQLCKGG